MNNYYKYLLVIWTVIMIAYGDVVTKVTSKNPMIPYLIVTFIYANLVVCIINLIFNLMKNGKRYERKSNGKQRY